MEVLSGYEWPGNVREIENLIEQMVTLSSSQRIDVDDIPLPIRRKRGRSALNDLIFFDELPLEQAVAQLERQMISRALEQSRHVQTRAAKLLGISRRQLKYKMDALGLSERRRG
ncbi:MAG: hypothetical protein MPW15_04230 [Candidatus Manganitrophus sp.]|nr:hypothetical protein [Candidatus Manganitrophus sp.]